LPIFFAVPISWAKVNQQELRQEISRRDGGGDMAVSASHARCHCRYPLVWARCLATACGTRGLGGKPRVANLPLGAEGSEAPVGGEGRRPRVCMFLHSVAARCVCVCVCAPTALGTLH